MHFVIYSTRQIFKLSFFVNLLWLRGASAVLWLHGARAVGGVSGFSKRKYGLCSQVDLFSPLRQLYLLSSLVPFLAFLHSYLGIVYDIGLLCSVVHSVWIWIYF